MAMRNILLAGTALSIGLAVPVSAQEADPQEGVNSSAEPTNAIVVTGSRIRRADIEGVGPTTVVDAEEIENTGIVNVETLLQRLPMRALRGTRALHTGLATAMALPK